MFTYGLSGSDYSQRERMGYQGLTAVNVNVWLSGFGCSQCLRMDYQGPTAVNVNVLGRHGFIMISFAPPL
jgi:hypothetical protein